jgi:histidyl-tRNA synthetase
VGWGMGDVTMQLFLEDWNLIPESDSKVEYMITLWPEDKDNKYLYMSIDISSELRKLGKTVHSYMEPNTKLDKQLKYADKRGVDKVIIVGESELESKSLTIKDMSTGNQETKSFDAFLNEIK